jgi:hypothetical protein
MSTTNSPPLWTPPAGYPMVQLNSDTVCLELELDFTGWWLSSPRLYPASDAACRSWAFGTSDQLGYKSGVSMISSLGLVFARMTCSIQENNFICISWFIIMDTNEQPNEEIHKWRYEETLGASIPSLGILCSQHLHELTILGALWTCHYVLEEFFFFVILGFELMASRLLGRRFTTWATSWALFCVCWVFLR